MSKEGLYSTHNHRSWLTRSLDNITKLQKEFDHSLLVDIKFKGSPEYDGRRFVISFLEDFHDNYVEFYGLSDEYKLKSLKKGGKKC